MSQHNETLKIKSVQRVSIAEYLTEQKIEYSDVVSFRSTPELKAKIAVMAKSRKMKPAEFLRQQMIAATECVDYTQ